jgi:hypothetical protein
MGDVTNDLSTLLRQEVDLAKAELRQEAAKAGRAGAMFTGAGVSGHMVLLFVSIAVWFGLSELIDAGWAALIVAVVWAAVAALLYFSARSQIRALRGLPQTVTTVREIPDALKPDLGADR